MIRIEFADHNHADVDVFPDECPYCHKSITPVRFAQSFREGYLELIFRCPNLECRKSFISTYVDHYSGGFYFEYSNIGTLIEYPFSNEINTISPSFSIIYNEAFFAEQHSLLQICGVGYRKALEFLIKDYLIKINPNREEHIKAKFLGKCIQDDVTDSRIKKVAQRAVWLGNDETHYTRLWGSDSLNDLKKLIDLTVHWIEMEQLTDSFELQMPDKK